MWKRLIALTLTFGLAANAPPALAQTACGLHEEMSKTLIQTFDERPLGRGLQTPIRMFEVWTSDATGSWTILLVRPDGLACVMASGQAWTPARVEIPGTPS
jgi:hypothetical protein